MQHDNQSFDAGSCFEGFFRLHFENWRSECYMWIQRHAKLIGFNLLLMSLAGMKRSGFDSSCPFGRKMRRESHGNGPVVSRQGSGITGRQQVPKYHAKNHGRRDGHALQPEAGGENQPGSCMWRKLLGDCWGKCKQIQAVNRILFTVDYKNRCTICIFASICRWLRATNSCQDLRPQLFHRGWGLPQVEECRQERTPGNPFGRIIGNTPHWKSNPMKC